MVTNHVGVTGIMHQFVYIDSKCLYTSTGTRHVNTKGVMQEFV
jgi:hypothetical protein